MGLQPGNEVATCIISMRAAGFFWGGTDENGWDGSPQWLQVNRGTGTGEGVRIRARGAGCEGWGRGTVQVCRFGREWGSGAGARGSGGALCRNAVSAQSEGQVRAGALPKGSCGRKLAWLARVPEAKQREGSMGS